MTMLNLSRLTQFGATFKLLGLALVCVLAIGVLAGLTACTNDDPAGSVIDRVLWDARGFPSEDEILSHLQEKYNEDFALISLNSGSRFFQGVAYPVNNPELHFSLQMKDEEGDPMPVQYMLDDYQARLAEVYIEELIRPVLIEKFGLGELANVRIDLALFDRGAEDSRLPESFEWTPADGLQALRDQPEISILLNIHLMLENAAVVDALTQEQADKLIESITEAGMPLDGSLELRAADTADADPATITWSMGERGNLFIDYTNLGN
jgi:hypothetical protein